MGALKVWDGSAWQTLANQGRPGSNVFVGPSTPPGTPTAGDMWYDTDEVSGLTMPITLANGGTGGSSAATARTSLTVPAIGNSAVTPGAPTTGTWARGDQWLDSAGVLWSCTVAGTPGTWVPPIGYELAYAQITASVSVTATSMAASQLVVNSGSRVYDGSPVMIEFFSPCVETAPGQWTVAVLYDGAQEIGGFGQVNASAFLRSSRKLTPTAGTHNYLIRSWVTAGTGAIHGGAGAGGGGYGPAHIRVTRA